jgi:4-oxalomesaconate tautomerase
MLMRGGSSKGAFFLAEDLPPDPSERDALLLRIMGSPDPRQIDGVGGAHPLTTKVAVVSPSPGDDVDLEYLFLQVAVDQAEVSSLQNCGNMLAAVGPFAVERGLIPARDGRASVRILMTNTGGLAVASFPVAGGRPIYAGDTAIAGVPGTGAEIRIEFEGIAGSSSGALLPTGHVIDEVAGVEVTLIDNGMPVVVMAAAAFGKTGAETPEQLEADTVLKAKVEAIRLKAGPMMKLGDVAKKNQPKMSLVSAPQKGGAISTRTFIPHKVHDAIGVFGAVSVATACMLPGSVAADFAKLPAAAGDISLEVEHPTGFFTIGMKVEAKNGSVVVRRAALLRTARLLMRGEVFVPESAWEAP